MAQGIRDSNGRFTKGNPGGPGNPYARQVARLRRLILQCVTDADLKAIIRALVQKAREGDVAAAREVLMRVVGKPPEGPDPDRLDLEEISLEVETAKALDDKEFQTYNGLDRVDKM